MMPWFGRERHQLLDTSTQARGAEVRLGWQRGGRAVCPSRCALPEPPGFVDWNSMKRC